MVLKSGIRARQPPASHIRLDFTMCEKKVKEVHLQPVLGADKGGRLIGRRRQQAITLLG